MLVFFSLLFIAVVTYGRVCEYDLKLDDTRSQVISPPEINPGAYDLYTCHWRIASDDNTYMIVSCNGTESPSCGGQIQMFEYIDGVFKQTRYCRNKNFEYLSLTTRLNLTSYPEFSETLGVPFSCVIKQMSNDIPKKKPTVDTNPDNIIDCGKKVTLNTNHVYELISTPDNPKGDPDGMLCIWHVESPENTKIALQCRAAPGDPQCRGNIFVSEGGVSKTYCRAAQIAHFSVGNKIVVKYLTYIPSQTGFSMTCLLESWNITNHN